MDQREVRAKEWEARTEEWVAAEAASRRAWATAGAAAEAAYSVRAAWLRAQDAGLARAEEWAKVLAEMEAWEAEAAAEAEARGRALEEAVAAAEAASSRCRTAL